MYFFRDEGGPREGTERSIGYRRHTLHLQRRDKALQHPPRLRREVAGHMDEGGAVGLQQAAQQLRRNVGVQQQGHFSRF